VSTTARQAEKAAEHADRLLDDVCKQIGSTRDASLIVGIAIAEQVRALRLAAERIPYAKDTQL
jgi:hypothetical protein